MANWQVVTLHNLNIHKPTSMNKLILRPYVHLHVADPLGRD